jgi:hypothetical protein
MKMVRASGAWDCPLNACRRLRRPRGAGARSGGDNSLSYMIEPVCTRPIGCCWGG